MPLKRKYVILITILGLIGFHFIPFNNFYLELTLYIILYAFIGYKTIFKALSNIFHGQIFDEYFLMSLATIGAFVIEDYAEAVFVMLFFTIGEMFEEFAVNRSRNNIKDLMDLAPDYANIMVDNELYKVNPENVDINDIIVVSAGEKIPLDGYVVSGEASLDMKSLTGESLPKFVSRNDYVLSGSININGLIQVKVSRKYSESTASKILELIEDASANKSNQERFISKFSKYYTPIVVLCALVIAFVLPIFLGNYQDYLYRALIFLVVSCPCALVISVPLSFFGGIGAASKNGILVKGSNYLEELSKVDTIIFDKTGTLTKGRFQIEKIVSKHLDEKLFLECVAYAEAYSNHPIALEIKENYGKEINLKRIKKVTNIAGKGIRVQIDSIDVLVGNDKLMQENNIFYDEATEIGSYIFMAINNEYQGYIMLNDTLKDEAVKTAKYLKKRGIKTIMLSGDQYLIASKIAKMIGIDDCYGDLLPDNKVEILEKYMSNNKVCYVGDGINDAPVLKRSNVGISMGNMGSDAAIEASDVVIMNDNLLKIVDAIKISKKTLKIVKQNIVFAIGVKLIVLALGALGFANMWLAVFSDVGVSVIAILNAIRCLKYKSVK